MRTKGPKIAISQTFEGSSKMGPTTVHLIASKGVLVWRTAPKRKRLVLSVWEALQFMESMRAMWLFLRRYPNKDAVTDELSTPFVGIERWMDVGGDGSPVMCAVLHSPRMRLGADMILAAAKQLTAALQADSARMELWS